MANVFAPLDFGPFLEWFLDAFPKKFQMRFCTHNSSRKPLPRWDELRRRFSKWLTGFSKLQDLLREAECQASSAFSSVSFLSAMDVDETDADPGSSVSSSAQCHTHTFQNGADMDRILFLTHLGTIIKHNKQSVSKRWGNESPKVIQNH